VQRFYGKGEERRGRKKEGKKKILSEEKTSNLPLISRKYYGLEIGF
jgi:hypothetical protein